MEKRNNKGQFIKGVAYQKGYKHTEETRAKIKEARARQGNNVWNKGLKGYNAGEKHPQWQGGKGGRGTKQQLIYREKLAGRQKPTECEICGAMGKICFDHDHATGLFRGWICWRCNVVLGHVKDSAELLEMLMKYIKKI